MNRDSMILLLILLLVVENISSFHLFTLLHRQGSSKLDHLYMSSVLKSKSEITSNSIPTDFKLSTKYSSEYLSAPISSSTSLGKKMTWQNKRYLDLGLKLRSKYTKFKYLSEEEEITAGKFSQVGKRIEKIQSSLSNILGREPTPEELSKAAGISIAKLDLYKLLSTKARNRLVQHNIAMVEYWVRRLLEHTSVGKEISYYELVTEGILGLTKAAEHYDGRTRFFYYAQNWIKSELFRGVTKLRPGSVATHRAALLNSKANRIRYQLEQILNRPPTDEEIAKEMNMKVKTLKAIQIVAKSKIISAETSLGSSKSTDSNVQNSYLDMYMKVDQSHYEIEKLLWKADFAEALGCLSSTEKRTLDLRYGLVDGTQKTIEKTASLMCTSAESIRTTVSKAFEKLRNSSSDTLFLGPDGGPPTLSMQTANGFNEAKLY